MENVAFDGRNIPQRRYQNRTFPNRVHKKTFFEKCPNMDRFLMVLWHIYYFENFSEPGRRMSRRLRNSCIVLDPPSVGFEEEPTGSESPILIPSLENVSTIKNNIFQAPGPPGTLK